MGFWFLPVAAFDDKYYAPDGYWDKMNTNKVKFADNKLYETGLEQLVEYLDRGFVNKDPLSTTFDVTKDNIAYGKAAMGLVAEWIYGPVMERTPDFEMGFFPMPIEDDRPGVLHRGHLVQCHPVHALAVLQGPVDGRIAESARTDSRRGA